MLRRTCRVWYGTTPCPAPCRVPNTMEYPTKTRRMGMTVAFPHKAIMALPSTELKALPRTSTDLSGGGGGVWPKPTGLIDETFRSWKFYFVTMFLSGVTFSALMVGLVVTVYPFFMFLMAFFDLFHMSNWIEMPR